MNFTKIEQVFLYFSSVITSSAFFITYESKGSYNHHSEAIIKTAALTVTDMINRHIDGSREADRHRLGEDRLD